MQWRISSNVRLYQLNLWGPLAVVKLYGKKQMEEETEEKRGDEIKNETGTLSVRTIPDFLSLKNIKVCSSEASIKFYHTTIWHYVSKHGKLEDSSGYGLLGHNTVMSALKMETEDASEMSVHIYQAMRRHI
jgi:hypothetical protein